MRDQLDIASVELTAGGERRSFRELYDQFNRPIYNFFANRRFRPEECRDLVQETFFRAFRASNGFRGEAKPSTWLMSIAKNVWLEEERSRSRLKRSAEEVSLETMRGEWGFDAASDEPDRQLRQFLEQEQVKLLQEALEELPNQMRSCIRLRICQELRYREIAEVMQTSIGTVKSQLAEARLRLRARLAAHFSVEV